LFLFLLFFIMKRDPNWRWVLWTKLNTYRLEQDTTKNPDQLKSRNGLQQMKMPVQGYTDWTFLVYTPPLVQGSSGPDSCSHPSEGRIELATQSGDRLLSVEKEFDLRTQQQSVEDLVKSCIRKFGEEFDEPRCADSKLLI
jgi:DNA recombination-dependent growth factor C